MKVFVDTNVLVDLVCSRTDFLREASILFDLGYRNEIKLSLCALSFINTYYIGLKYKYPPLELQQALMQIQKFVEISDLSGKVIANAFDLQVKDFEDASQYFAAKACDADVIVTRNKKDFAFSSIEVLTPMEFLEKYM